MGFFDLIKNKLFVSKSVEDIQHTENYNSEEEVSESIDIHTSEAEQQFQKIKDFIASDDMANHELAAMLIKGLGIIWDEEMYINVSKSAEKMIFWANQDDNDIFLNHFRALTINQRFFSQYNEIAEFADVLYKFKNLVSLEWNAKHYWNQHPVLIAAANLPELKKLYAIDCRMNFLPEAISDAGKLEELYLSGNKLTELPESLEKLTNLKVLDLSANQFRNCPRTVCRLSRLEVLRLHNNPVKDINFKFLGRLYKLRDLQLPYEFAKENYSLLKDWLPDVDFQKTYWHFES